ncbi:MAG: hypothetical protein HXY22_08525 [Alphaproteobacteria bacterium]|nr:hypothetical protein [Alphaproteobacteria bacterium]
MSDIKINSPVSGTLDAGAPAESFQNDPLLPVSVAGLLLWAAAMTMALAAVLLAPVASFVFLLAGFGLAHVLAEMRFIDARFSTRATRPLWHVILGGIAGIALTRLLFILGWIAYAPAVGIEVGIGIVLAAGVAALAPRHRLPLFIGLIAFAALAIGSPIHALLVVALLHNLTPLAFIAEAVPPGERRRIVLFLLVPFVLLPLFIASGAGHGLLEGSGLQPSLWAPQEAGPPERYFSAFLPAWSFGEAWAIDVFAAAVFAQAMHYLAVIVVMPRLQPRFGGGTALPWPQGRLFWLAIAGVSLALLAVYSVDYALARQLYALAAAMHSWLEVPLLVLLAGSALKPTSA